MELDALAMHLGVPGGTGYRFRRAVIDSRHAGPGTLFFALPGSRADGHDFVCEAVSRGAAAVVSRERCPGPVLVVPDTGHALLEAGRWARNSFRGRVVAVTGSSGKTTTRELLMLALGTAMSVDGTRENLNNRLGLPLTLLNACKNAEVLVLEAGMNHAGELLELGGVARPDVAVVTNIGTAHIEFLGSRQGIALAKAELLRTTTESGGAVIPAGEPILSEAAAARGLSVLTAGPGGDAWLQGGIIMPWGLSPRLSVPGAHNLENALSAALAASLLGVGPESALKAMSGYTGMPGRGRVVSARGVTVFDESYNANPDSTLACLELLKGAGGRGVAVLGDMLELGVHARQAHRTVLDRALGLGLRLVVLVGKEYELASRGEPGLLCVPDASAALALLLSEVGEGDRVLVKGSHSLGLAHVVHGLLEEGN